MFTTSFSVAMTWCAASSSTLLTALSAKLNRKVFGEPETVSTRNKTSWRSSHLHGISGYTEQQMEMLKPTVLAESLLATTIRWKPALTRRNQI
jgi:hypothetical protein